MTPILSTLKTSGRAAIVAVTLGAAMFTAAPAMAQPTPSFNFSFGVGGDGKPSVGFGVNSGRDYDRGDYFCMSDRQIVRSLRDEGYRDIEIGRDLGRNRVGVIAKYGRSYYSMRVNRCTGEVDRIQKIRNFRSGSGFGLQFNF
jgi:hypothetical protein